MINKKILTFAAIAVFSSVSQAEIVDTDWKSEGDALAFVDADTGIEWLKLDYTAGMTIEEGLSIDGWRLATASEVEDLVSHIVPSYFTSTNSYNSYTKYVNSEQWSTWNSIMGIIGYDHGRNWSFGQYLDGDGVATATGTDFWYQSQYYPSRLFKLDADGDSKTSYSGVYLVSDGGTTLSSINDPTINASNPNAPVNQVPASLFGLALCGMLVSARKRCSKRI